MNVLKHRFVSAKTDGADATQVQPSHWNDGHGFTGGAAGDVLTRDLTDAAFGATWAAPFGRVLLAESGSHTSTTGANMGLLGFAAGQLGLNDTLTVNLFVALQGPVPAPVPIDLYGLGSPANAVILTLTGAAGAGNLTQDVVLHSHTLIRASPLGVGVFSAMSTGVLSTGAGQSRGFSFAALSGVDTWTGAWTLLFRQLTGVPAGSELTWRCQIVQQRGT